MVADPQKQLRKLTSKLNALKKQISRTESSHGECESSRRSSISSASDRLFVAQCLSENDSFNEHHLVNSTSYSNSKGKTEILVNSNDHQSREVSISSSKSITNNNSNLNRIDHSQEVSLSSRTVERTTSIADINGKDEMIEFLQKKLLEKSHKEMTLEKEIERLKSMLRNRTESFGDIESDTDDVI